MRLPKQYQWIDQEGGPKVLLEMRKLYGILEATGDADNPTIIAWAKELGPKVGIEYKRDSAPWCGLVAGIAALRAGYEPPDICVRASSWDHFGDMVEGAPMLGDFLRFERTGGGHIGIYVGEDRGAFHVLGGNQADSVNISRISKNRLVTARRSPWKLGQPAYIRRVFLTIQGNISKNEV